MLDIYICEDNAIQREFVASFISDYCVFRDLDAAVVLACPSPEEILAHYENAQNPALFFLDIELGARINGIELASLIREQGKKASIVFLTTHSEMTLLTFHYKVEALDFIIKDSPDNIKRKVAECVNTALERHTQGGKAKALKITVGDKTLFLDRDDIILIETTPIRHKLRLHTKNRTLEFNAELKTMEEQLGDRFVRCHKSYIINKDKIAAFNQKDNTVTMANKSTCPVSRSGKKLL